jgi:PAS domain S-box-containing protein/diguanylate cyclase (GGDEF)-like protein
MWASAIGTTAYVLMSYDGVQRYLQDHADRLLTALCGDAVDTRAASEIGARLVADNFTGPQSLSRSVEVLGKALPSIAERAGVDSCPHERVCELLGALVAGYIQAVRERIFDEQEEIQQSLLAAQRNVEHDLRASEARFREVFNASAVGIALTTPDRVITETNPALDAILGYCPGELLGRDLGEMFAGQDESMAREHYQSLLSGEDGRFRVRFRLRRKDGETAWAYLAASVIHDSKRQTQHIATLVEDISDLYLLEQRLNHQALHDLRTGLPNRQYFVSHLEKVLGRLTPSTMITLLHLDLDGFSAINDGLGYSFGDRLLDVVGGRLQALVADEQAMVARLGGDEYGILIEPGETVPDVGKLAEAINIELAEPFYQDGIGIGVTATIGVVQRRVSGNENPAELLRDAGATLRRLQGKVTRQWTMFDAEIDKVSRPELRMAAAMPGALETGELRVEYQPVMTLEHSRLVGIEAVLNWEHPQLGLLTGAQCLRVAERTGAVHAIGHWLLRAAAHQAVQWRQMSDHVPPVVVNLTRANAQDPDLVAKVRAVLEETELRPAELELRVPVGAIRYPDGRLAGEGGANAEDNLRVLAELGVLAGLHDFSGGVGSLRCMAELPVSAVRVAKAIRQQVEDDRSRILSQAVHALVHIVRNSGINVVAFPADTEAQAACWRWVGANWAVGALFGEAGPATDVEPLFDLPR